MECSTIPCGKLPASQKRRVVWMIDKKPYCNSCYLDWMETHEIRREVIKRLYDNEDLYDDIRRQKRRGRKSQQPGIRSGTAHAVQA